MNIEGIEDVRPPVAQHFSTIIELIKVELVAGIEPEIESAFGFGSVRSGHEVVEGFLQRIALRQFIGEAKHHVKGSLVLVGQFIAVLEQQPAGAFEVLSLRFGKGLLEAPANVIHGFRAKFDNVEAVDDDLRIGKEGSGHIAKTAVHVHDGVLDLVPIGEGTQIILYTFHSSFGQNVQNTVVQRVGDDALEPFSAQISLEFVEGDCLGQRRRFGYGERVQNPVDAAQGDSHVLGDGFQAAAPMQQGDDFFCYAMGEALIASGEAACLGEFLAAFEAEVAPVAVVERRPLAAQIQIAYRSMMIVVNATGLRPACGAALRLLHKLYLNRELLRVLFYVF